MGSSSVQTCGETATYCRYSEKEIESAGILDLANQFGNRPHVIRNSSFHRGRHSQTGMHSTKVVVREVQGDSGFQMGQLFAESVREPRKSAKLHPHREILPLDEARTRVRRRIRNSAILLSTRSRVATLSLSSARTSLISWFVFTTIME